jgi:hypothetical protein
MQPPLFEPLGPEDHTRKLRTISSSTVTLQADRTVLASLANAIQQAITTMPAQGVEVGGFLTGSVGSVIRIDGFEMAEIRPWFDRSPSTSPRPALLFRNRLSNPEKQVIGFFRSHTKGLPGVVEADGILAGLLRDLLHVSDPVLLLLPGSPYGLLQARLYRRQDTRWVHALQFPLISHDEEMPAAPIPASDRSGATPPWPGSGWHANPPDTNRLLKTSLLWGLAAGLVVAAGISYFATSSRPPSANPSPLGLGLAVRRADSGMQVQWNPKSPDVEHAVSGLLTIQQGNRIIVIPLGQQQLRRGSTLYVSRSAQAEIRLDVYQDQVHFRTESVTSSPTVSADLHNDSQTGATPSNGKSEPGALSNRTHEIKREEAPSRSSPKINAQRKQTIVLADSGTMTPKPFAGIPATPTQAPDRSAGRTDFPAPPQISQLLPERAPELAAPTPKLPLPPANPIAPPPINYVAASSVRKVQPAIPADLRAAVQGLVSVEVKVGIDRAGKVVQATPFGVATAAQKLLAPEAARAALLWQFDPARQNGTPVYSEAVLRFEFERPPR